MATDTERAEIVESIARALFVSSFAAICDELAAGDAETAEDFEGLSEESRERLESQAAGMGGDWMDTVTDDTPAEAFAVAEEIASAFEERNRRALAEACEEWLLLDHYYARREPSADDFGHYLAMESIGHGVGLWDNIKRRRDATRGFEHGYAGEDFSAWDWI